MKAATLVTLAVAVGCSSYAGGEDDVSGDENAAVAGRSFYVDCGAGSDSAAGSITAPWRSIGRVNTAMSTLVAGDTVFFKRGTTCSGSLNINNRTGTATAPITFTSYGTGELPILQNPVINQTYKIGSIIGLVNSSYIVIDGLYVRENNATRSDKWPTKSCTNEKGTFNTIVGDARGVRIYTGSYNTVRNIKGTNLTFGVYIDSGARFNQVYNNEFRDNNMMFLLTAGGNDDAGGVAVAMHGHDNDIHHNVFANNYACSFDFGWDGGALDIFGGQRNRVHHNRSTNDPVFVELGGQNGSAADNVVYYNTYVVDDPKMFVSGLIITRGGGSWGPVNRTLAYNNTAYIPSTHPAALGVVCSPACSPSILTLRNNIIWADRYVIWSEGGFNESNNIFYATDGTISSTVAINATSKVANPQFVNLGARDFHLLSSSPAINAGVDLRSAGLNSDLDGTAVPSGSLPDIGAFEFKAPAPSIVQNPSFESGVTPWFMNLKNGASAVVAQDATTARDGTRSAKITNRVVTTDWYAQLMQENIPVQGGRTYRVSFAAKAGAASAIRTGFNLSASPWTSQTTTTQNLTTAWATYTFDFVPTATANLTMNFNVGNALGDVWIDHVQMTAL